MHMSVCACIVCMCLYVEIRVMSVHTNTCNTYQYVQIHTPCTIHKHTCIYIQYTQYIQYIPYIHIHTHTYIYILIHTYTYDTCSYISDTYRYIHIQHFISAYTIVCCMYCTVSTCMYIYVHVFLSICTYVYVCISGDCDSKKM